SQALVNELLYTLPSEGFRSKEIALRIRRNAMHGIELARLPSAIAKARQGLKRTAQKDVHLIVSSIGQVYKRLLRILREGDFPDGTSTLRLLTDEDFLHECAVRFEHLNPVVHAVAYIQQAIDRKSHAVHRIAELLIDRG